MPSVGIAWGREVCVCPCCEGIAVHRFLHTGLGIAGYGSGVSLTMLSLPVPPVVACFLRERLLSEQHHLDSKALSAASFFSWDSCELTPCKFSSVGITVLVGQLEARSHLPLSSLPLLALACCEWCEGHWKVEGQSSGQVCACFILVLQGYSGGQASWTDICSAEGEGAIYQLLGYYQCAWCWQGQKKFLPMVAVCLGKASVFSPRNSPETIFASACLQGSR